MVSAFTAELLWTKWINISKFCTHGVLRSESTECSQLNRRFDWLNAPIINDMLGTHPGGHSASIHNNDNMNYFYYYYRIVNGKYEKNS